MTNETAHEAASGRAPERASARWRAGVEARLEEMARLQTPIDDRYWNTSAERFARRVAGSAEHDPFLHRVRHDVDSHTRVIDVGSGPGRFSIALAPIASEVTALDPSRAMLDILERDARQRGIHNVRVREARLEEVDGLEAEIVICSYVIPLVADLLDFADRLDRIGRRRVFVYMNAVSADAVTDPFWRHFHGRPRQPAPTYLDALGVLEELGIDAQVEIVASPTLARFDSLDEAVEDYRRLLVVPETPETTEELESLLRPWLVHRDGALRPPLARLPAAIISWEPTARARRPEPRPGRQ